MTFQIGEKVVYPNHGVGTVENISSRCFGSHSENFYLLRLCMHSLTVMVPFSHVEELGIRKVTKNGEVGRVLTFLANGRCRFKNDWKDRFKENCEKMRVGSLLDIAEVMKSLLILSIEKPPLSFREKKMLERSRQMLITEVSASRGVSEEAAIEILKKALSKGALPMPDPL